MHSRAFTFAPTNATSVHSKKCLSCDPMLHSRDPPQQLCERQHQIEYFNIGFGSNCESQPFTSSNSPLASRQSFLSAFPLISPALHQLGNDFPSLAQMDRLRCHRHFLLVPFIFQLTYPVLFLRERRVQRQNCRVTSLQVSSTLSQGSGSLSRPSRRLPSAAQSSDPITSPFFKPSSIPTQLASDSRALIHHKLAFLQPQLFAISFASSNSIRASSVDSNTTR